MLFQSHLGNCLTAPPPHHYTESPCALFSPQFRTRPFWLNFRPNTFRNRRVVTFDWNCNGFVKTSDITSYWKKCGPYSSKMHTIVQGLSETSNGLIDTEIHTFGKGSIAFYGLDNNTLGERASTTGDFWTISHSQKVYRCLQLFGGSLCWEVAPYIAARLKSASPCSEPCVHQNNSGWTY